jgi:hypothetical protein
MEILIITQNGNFIEALPINTHLEEWAKKWLFDSGKNIEIDYHENGKIYAFNSEIQIFGDNGLFILDVLHKTI